MWRALSKGHNLPVARCTVERLMKRLGIKGVVRGRKVFTTKADPKADTKPDLVNRNFSATRPNELWLADFTYVRTLKGFVFVAFILDVFSRKILGWKVSSNMRTELVESALDQALATSGNVFGLVHHSDRGSQYTSIQYSLRLVESGIMASVGSTGDSYDNAMAETIIGLYKAEVIERQSSWKSLQEVEWATMVWVNWFNNKRLFSSIGYICPQQMEERFYAQMLELKSVA
jgi:transposase InsO family protein